MITTYGMCPGVKSGENEVQAEARQRAYYGDYRVNRIFFPETLMGQENSNARSARTIIAEMNPDEDLIVSCKLVGSEFPARVTELKSHRTGRGRTRIIIHHEPEGDLTVAAYNTKWNTALPTLEAEKAWLEPGTCHTAFWSRKVDANGVRENDWRDWIPSNSAVQRLLKFVSADLYPSAGRPTKSKPKYYEPPGAHQSPYGAWQEIGFCGILDEMLDELRGPQWPNITSELEGGIAEINHERPGSTWPTGFANSDPAGQDNAAWLNDVLEHADGRYAFFTHFHKGGGILTDRTPQTEAQLLRSWIRSTYDDVEAPEVTEPDPTHPQYRYGYDAGVAARNDVAQREIAEARAAGMALGRGEVAAAVMTTLGQFNSY
jgi:hypothetical protein